MIIPKLSKSLLCGAVKAGLRAPLFAAGHYVNYQCDLKRVVYLVEGAEWAIKWVGNYVSKGVNSRGLKCETDISPYFYSGTLLHLGSLNCFKVKHLTWYALQKKRIITIFHGDYGINKAMDHGLDTLLKNKNIFSRFVVSNSIMERRLTSWGIDSQNIVKIPLGVDLERFWPSQSNVRSRLRKDMGIPEGCICVGSFQKDGVGWGDGIEPKWIKGPDIFVEAMKEIAKKHKVHCLLTGPARGYVKKALEKHGIPYTHRFVRHYFDLVKFYNCLDMYLVTSREEGGPKSILEAMAVGIPVVSTPVGMAVDIIRDGENGFITKTIGVKEVAEKALYVADNAGKTAEVVKNAFETVRAYDWYAISSSYYDMYKELLDEARIRMA